MNCILFCFILIFAVSPMFGQQKESRTLFDVPTNCEDVQRILGTTHELTRSGNLIIISRLGNGESSTSLNQIRLKNVKNYLETVWKRRPETLVLAIGEKVPELGRVEFYVLGELAYVIVAKKGKNILTLCNTQP